MVLRTCVKVAIAITAVVAVFAENNFVDDSALNEDVLYKELEALLSAEGNSTSTYAVTRNPPNWAVRFVKRHGYPIEIHQVKTKDGYLLTLHRIPGSKDGKRTKGAPILLHHGFMGCSGDFVVLGPQKALAFILADLGYDVWMANARGSTDSRQHDTLKPTQPAFWDFSWHEIGEKDIPAEIDYILGKTGRTSLSYIGFSMGTTSFFVMSSERPEYVPKVNKMIALAPVAYMEHVRGPLLRYLAPLTAKVAVIARLLGASGEFAPSTTFMKWAAQKFCNNNARSQIVCSNVLFMLFGFANDFVDSKLVELLSEFVPAGASLKGIRHFGQLIQDAPTFSKFDYGFFKNKPMYGDRRAPQYNISRVSCPVHAFISTNDWFSTAKDALNLFSHLPNVRTATVVGRPSFTHFDFIYAKDANELIYQHIVDILKKEDF